MTSVSNSSARSALQLSPVPTIECLAIAFHLVLVGIPFQFGLLPTGWGKSYSDACVNFFDSPNCSYNERYAFREFGIHFISFYELSIVSFVLTMSLCFRTSSFVALHSFNKIILTTTISSFIFFSFYADLGFLSGRKGPMEETFSRTFSLCQVAACCCSFAVILFGSNSTELQSTRPTASKWSIPANAIFSEAVSGFPSDFGFGTKFPVLRRCNSLLP